VKVDCPLCGELVLPGMGLIGHLVNDHRAARFPQALPLAERKM
jgi:hypothetical protein